MKNYHLFSVLTLLPCLAFATSVLAEGAAAPKKIVKWKDEKGVVHYGDALPPQDAGRGNAVLSQDGVVVRKNDSYKLLSQTDQAAEAATAEQMRKDSALLASYSSVEEIDLAMERNLQSEQGSLNVQNQRLIDAKKSLAQKEEKLNKIVKAGKPAPSYLQDEVKSHRQKIAKIEADIAVTQREIQSIKSRYAGYKMRYTELRPRDLSLSKINVNKKNLAELERWKADASHRLSQYLNETKRYKRGGEPIPDHVTQGVQQANDEISRADQEIAAIKANIKDSQQSFSSR